MAEAINDFPHNHGCSTCGLEFNKCTLSMCRIPIRVSICFICREGHIWEQSLSAMSYMLTGILLPHSVDTCENCNHAWKLQNKYRRNLDAKLRRASKPI